MMVENRSVEDEFSSDSESESEVQKSLGEKKQHSELESESESESDSEAPINGEPEEVVVAEQEKQQVDFNGDSKPIGQKKQHSKSESESESDSDSEEKQQVEFNGDSKPTGDAELVESESEKLPPMQTDDGDAILPNKVSSKRPAVQSDDDNEIKLRKINTDSVQRKRFERVFSCDDEVILLQGYIEHLNKGGDKSSFYQSIRESLSCDVSKTQVDGKLRKLKLAFIRGRIIAGSRIFYFCKQLWEDNANDEKELKVLKHVRKGERAGQGATYVIPMNLKPAAVDNGIWSAWLSHAVEENKHKFSVEKREKFERIQREIYLDEIKLSMKITDLRRQMAEEFIKVSK